MFAGRCFAKSRGRLLPIFQRDALERRSAHAAVKEVDGLGEDDEVGALLRGECDQVRSVLERLLEAVVLALAKGKRRDVLLVHVRSASWVRMRLR